MPKLRPDRVARPVSPDAPDDTWFNRREAAVFLGLSPQTLANLRHQQDAPPCCYLGAKSPRYNAGALRRWRDERNARQSNAAETHGATTRRRHRIVRANAAQPSTVRA